MVKNKIFCFFLTIQVMGKLCNGDNYTSKYSIQPNFQKSQICIFLWLWIKNMPDKKGLKYVRLKNKKFHANSKNFPTHHMLNNIP